MARLTIAETILKHGTILKRGVDIHADAAQAIREQYKKSGYISGVAKCILNSLYGENALNQPVKTDKIYGAEFPLFGLVLIERTSANRYKLVSVQGLWQNLTFKSLKQLDDFLTAFDGQTQGG